MADVRQKVGLMDALPTLDRDVVIMAVVPGVDNYQMTVGELEDYLAANINNILKLGNKSADFTYTLPANSKLLSIDFKEVLGDPVVSVGTTPGGEELVESQEIILRYDTGTILPIDSDTDIYFSISGGTVSVNIWILLNLY